MNNETKIQLNLSVSESYRNLLRRMAAERMMNDPTTVVTGTSIATEILLEALQKLAGTIKEEGGKNNE